MAYSPADLRTGQLHFLLDLEWAGITYRLSDGYHSPVIDGATLDYSPGLVSAGQFEERLDLFATLPTSHSEDVTLDLSSLVNVPKRIKDGHPLGAAVATLYLWATGTTERRTLLKGRLRQVQHGSKDEPVTATIEEAPLRAPGLVPGDGERVGAVLIGTDFTDPAPSAHGQFYPIIFGRPGGSTGYGSPLLFEDMDANPILASTGVVAAHPCVGGTITIVDHANDTTETRSIQSAGTQWWQPATSKTVVETFTHPATSGDQDNAYYIRWSSPNAGGVPSRDDPTIPMRNAGEIMSWLLRKSGARVDWGRMRVLEEHLAGFMLDAAIVPGDQARVSPTEWIHAHLLPILPVTPARSDNGLHYVFWKWDATASDALVSLNADEGQAAREGAVDYSDHDSLYQAVRLDYARDYRLDTLQGSMLYTGQRELAESGEGVFLDQRLGWSYRLHAEENPTLVRTLEVRSEVVLDDATAHLVCGYLSRRHGLQSRILQYTTGPEFSWLRPGDVITLTDTDIDSEDNVALVDGVTWTDSDRFGLALRLLPDLAPR